MYRHLAQGLPRRRILGRNITSTLQVGQVAPESNREIHVTGHNVHRKETISLLAT